MFCPNCGKPVPAGAATCPECHAVVIPPPRSGAENAVDQIVTDLGKGTKEILRASAHLTKKVVSKAGDAAKDPAGSAKKATKKVAHGIHQVAKDIDKELKDL